MSMRHTWILLAALGTIGCGPNEESCRFSLLLTDAPGQFEQVPITISGFQARLTQQVATQKGKEPSGANSEGEWIQLRTQEQTRDLLQLRDGKTAALGEDDLPAGHYNRIRLVISRAQVVQNGATHDLEVPGGAESGLELNLSFQARAGESYEMLLDLDAEQSILSDASGFRFAPKLMIQRFAYQNGKPVETAADGQ